jgi:hypothetical protein
MEQIFHTNNKSANDLKLPALKQTRISSKLTGLGDNQTLNIHCNDKLHDLHTNDLIENEIPKLLNQKTFIDEQKNKKKSTYVLSNKKPTSQKVSRSPLNGNVRRSRYNRNQVDGKSENQDKLKAYSESNVAHKKLNQTISNNDANVGSKSQAVQTLDANDLDSLYSEGIIRYFSFLTFPFFHL